MTDTKRSENVGWTPGPEDTSPGVIYATLCTGQAMGLWTDSETVRSSRPLIRQDKEKARRTINAFTPEGQVIYALCV
jgi:hypothetical protein